MKTIDYVAAGVAVGFWTSAYLLSTRDSIPLALATACVAGFLVSAAYSGYRFVMSASDVRSDGREAVIYSIGYGLIALITLFPLANLILALLGYYLNPRLVGFAVSTLSLFIAPFTVLILIACRHAAGIFPRIISPAFAVFGALLCRMFYR